MPVRLTFPSVLSALCEPVRTWRSSGRELISSAGERLPLRQCSGAAFLRCGVVARSRSLAKWLWSEAWTEGQVAVLCPGLAWHQGNL